VYTSGLRHRQRDVKNRRYILGNFNEIHYTRRNSKQDVVKHTIDISTGLPSSDRWAETFRATTETEKKLTH
jgi:hypothetical protein